MIPAVRSWTRDEMVKRVAFFKDLKGSKTGLPDSDLLECERELISVIGFQPQIELLRYGQTGESSRRRLLAAAATAPLAPLMPLDSFPIAIVDWGDRYDRLIRAILKYVPFKRE